MHKNVTTQYKSGPQSKGAEKSVAENLIWWGATPLLQNETRHVRLGSLAMKISRQMNEWQLEYHRPSFQDEAVQDFEMLDGQAPMAQPSVFERFLFGGDTNSIHIEPRLADKPVAIKPLSPIYIPAKEKGMLFVSSPLWMAGYVAEKTDPLFDMPIIRPKDSWFGLETTHGHACYASNVFGRTDLTDIVPKPFRATTPIHFTNASDAQLPLTRLSLPAPSLQLYYSQHSGRMWTSTIVVTQEDAHSPIKIKISNKSPKEAGKTIAIGKPRVMDAQAALMRMFDF